MKLTRRAVIAAIISAPVALATKLRLWPRVVPEITLPEITLPYWDGNPYHSVITQIGTATVDGMGKWHVSDWSLDGSRQLKEFVRDNPLTYGSWHGGVTYIGSVESIEANHQMLLGGWTLSELQALSNRYLQQSIRSQLVRSHY